jgi:DNA-binding beta-propeller fold protein YncE
LAATLATLCALGLSLAAAPAAHATTYLLKGTFDKGTDNLGVAVDQSNDDVYVTNYYFGVDRFSSSGASPETFLPSSSSFTNFYAGIAVNPTNQDVYVYDAGEQKIDTFEPSGTETELRHFTVTGGQYAFVQIASDSAGDVYYPNQAAKTVQEFAPTAEGASPAPVLTIAPTEAQLLVNPALALVNPQGVAVDSVHGKVYVVDSGNGGVGRVQVFNASSGVYESTLDEGGAQDVAVDPVSGDVFVLDLNSEGTCAPQSSPCYRVRAYHTGGTTSFAELGVGRIGNSEPGIPNHVAVDHKTGDVYVSAFGEKVLIFAPGTPPEVTYPPAPSERVTSLTASEATLHGEVNPQGSEVSCHFEYGTSTTYEHSMPCQPELVGKGSTFEPEAVTIKGLEGNTEYHFRLVATTAAGEIFAGVDETFMTAAARPVVVGESFSGVTPTDAMLAAQINPENQATTYHFEYATEHTGEELKGATTVPGGSISGGEAQAVGPVDIGGVLQPGTTYYYRVVAENGTPPATDGPIQSFTTIGRPLVSTGEAQDISRTTATLAAGTIDPVGAETTYHFVYIDQAGYEAALARSAANPYAEGGSTSEAKLGASYETQAVAAVTAGGLLAETTYHYALVASNEVGEVTGPDKTFTTSSRTPPMVTTGGASGISLNAASVSGTVDTQGLDASYGFEIGTEAGSYGPATGLGSVGAGLSETVTLALQNLQPGVTYHYRIEAANVDGVAYGADQSFTTPGFPALLTLPATAPLIAAPAIAFPTETGTTSKPTPKALTRAQKLANALKACMKKPKKQRAGCKKQAHKQFGPAKKKKGKKG